LIAEALRQLVSRAHPDGRWPAAAVHIRSLGVRRARRGGHV